MIPITLKISGFLSYRDPVELDFTGFDLACISGANGAGKSSLLDAVTWALFGQARKTGEALVNAQSPAAEVTLTFEYEGAVYRVQRSLPRGKSTVLEFQILDDGSLTMDDGPRSVVHRLSSAPWRTLSERTARDTQARIEHVLRMDYETFVNASFFLQGKADQFTQQTASRRKEVLSNILGLEVWDTYKERTAARRKEIERELDETDGRIAEINAELDEEDARKTRLAELGSNLDQLSAARKMAESTLEALRRAAASLTDQRKLAESLAAALARSEQNLAGLEARLAERQAERGKYADLLARADEVESAYQAWQKARDELARWEESAVQFREQEARRQPFVEQIAVKKARLEQERGGLSEKLSVINEQSAVSRGLQEQIETAQKTLAEAESQLAEREAVEKQAADGRERQAELKAENQELKAQMDEMKARLNRLESVEGAACPLCGQPLSEEHRLSTLAQLESEGKSKGDRYRANQAELKTLEASLADYALRITHYASAEQTRQSAATSLAQLSERLESLQKSVAEWESQGAPRLAEVVRLLESESFADEAHQRLAEIDAELKSLGYDAAAHDNARQAEVQGRAAETDFRALESARAALGPLEADIAHLQSQVESLRGEVGKGRGEYEQTAGALAQAESQAPDVQTAERQLFDLQEQENRLNQEVGAARQAVTVLDTLRQRKAGLETQAGDLRRQIGQHKTLERAFGKDGVPALLIEQSLPQIEEKANDLLDRLSNGMMRVRFATQAGYKDKKRDDLKETLDIVISDPAGERDYEMFSGGEAFRVNFAIRLALSEVLAQRKGARLQTLVIDEGFGSQDTQGRQRLIEAINLVRKDFAKVLVITHMDELKDAFPTRIEVEKTERGSAVRVV
jgi:exonuclease SbcC